MTVYCGTNAELPNDDYERHGTSYECLRKGVGVGLYLQRVRQPPQNDKPWRILIILLMCFLYIAWGASLIYFMKNESTIKGERRIIVIICLIVFPLILGLLSYYFIKKM